MGAGHDLSNRGASQLPKNSVIPAGAKQRAGLTPLNASSSVPSRWIRFGVAIVFIAICLLALWSLTVGDFVTSPTGRSLALTAAISMAMAMGLWTYLDPSYTQDTPERARLLARSPVLANPVARVLLVGVFSGLMTFEAVSGALFEFWTLAFGRPSEQTLHLGAYNSSSRYNCSGFGVLEMPLRARVICASYRYDEAPPPGTPVLVRGPASALGIKIEHFQIIPGG
jgi:hypothetical protein